MIQAYVAHGRILQGDTQCNGATFSLTCRRHRPLSACYPLRPVRACFPAPRNACTGRTAASPAATTTTPTPCCRNCVPASPLQLRRQHNKPHDERAIEVFWRKYKLGHLPRIGNAAAASLFDRARALRTEVIGIDDPDEGWEPVRLRVWT